MKRLFAALLTAALLLAGCAPAGEGLSSAPAETVTGFRWGGEEDTLHQFADHDGSINGYRDYTITACFSADGEASPPVPLTMEQIGSQFFTDLQERVPQPPPEELNFTAPYTVVEVEDAGETVRYLSLADGSLLTVQGGFCYYLGEKDPMRLLSAFIAGAEERVELLPPDLTVDETPFGLEPEHPVTVPDGAAIAVGITSGRANAGSLLLGEEGTEAVAGVLGSVTDTVPLEPMSVTALVNITVVSGDTVDRYAIRGRDELLDYQNHVLWALPEEAYPTVLTAYAAALAAELPEMSW